MVGKEELVNLVDTAGYSLSEGVGDLLEERRQDLVKLMRRTDYKHFLPADGRYSKGVGGAGPRKRKGKGKGGDGRRRGKRQGGGRGPPKRTSKTSILRENFETQWANS